MSQFRAYSGREIMELQVKTRPWLVENLIREKDSFIIVGNEKSGKSILSFQLMASLTSGHPFLNRFNVFSPRKVTYIQLEGQLSDSVDRLQRMSKVVEIDPDNFQIIYLGPIELQIDSNISVLLRAILEFHQPDVVIIDPLYFAFSGSLSDDNMVRKFLGNLRRLQDTLNCAMALVHHTHKQRFATDGNRINEGDEAIFGSKFFKAWADHTLLFDHNNTTGVRSLSCNTQRSGDIIKQCLLKLIEPDPLYFEEMSTEIPRAEIILDFLRQNPNGATVERIMKELKMKKNTFYNSIKVAIAKNLIKKDGTKPVIYSINEEK